MPGPSDALWEINNEYRKRLTALMSHMKLLEQLLVMQGHAEPGLRAAIRRIRAVLEEIDADQHDWRHTYFYRPPEGDEKRRMVSDPQAVQTALRTFDAMFAGHMERFKAIAATMNDLPRPDPALTKVIKQGDLWQMCLDGVDGLAAYDQFVHEQGG